MSRTHLVPSAALLVAALASAAPASAQDVAWRRDYAAARREATDTGRPLFLDFGTEACGWCQKLDATTLRDPNVVALLNERFIPVKLDGNKEQRLTAALGVEGFPTLVVATADGKVVGRHAGYADAAQLTALLGKAPAAPPAGARVVRPVAAPAGETAGDAERRLKAEIDAGLAACTPSSPPLSTGRATAAVSFRTARNPSTNGGPASPVGE